METDNPVTAAMSSSQHTSTSQIEKEGTLSRAHSRQTSQHETEKNTVETTPLDEAEALDNLSDEPIYPQGAKLGIIVASLCLSVFCVALDNTIIATAIPKITDHFKALDDVGWYGAGRIIALFVVFGVLAVAFAIVQLWKGDNATVPPRILKKRSIAFGAWFVFCVGGSFFVLVYYLPIWFQAIKGVSAVESGIRNLPMILGLVIVSIVSGILITVFGYYTPWMILSSLLMAVGAGLMSTFKVGTGHSMWIGFQALYGFGVGAGLQQGMIAAQTVCTLDDVPTAVAIMNFCSTLGGALFIAVGQNIFTNRLSTNLATDVPILNPSIVLNTGATSLRDAVGSASLEGVLKAYNDALTHTYYVSVAVACLSIIGALGMEWKSVKGKKTEAVAS
ncbi:hypothetical protein IMSHALPRED_000629 [Imshaugia aleurites]|uniref:Uncharacterized protein n=1 Tax=Imshaugia aleurites TaxID=172621 RepID=A0A8H3GAQ4_9LECA|nr:hypothetical protein IMSHALPRED_000629 [Imshaugia aleurites]